MGEKKDTLNLSDLGSAMGKLQGLAKQNPNVLEGLAPKVKKRVEALKEIQKQYDDLEAKYFEERAVLEAKYQKLYEPLYAKRYEIVSGAVEVEAVADESTEEAFAEKKTSEETTEKGVPNFWLTALKNNDVVAQEIQERDQDALKFLKDIRWSKTDEPKGFKLEFIFDPNPYFKNSVLTKTYEMVDENEPILEKATGTEIEWYAGKCLTKKIMKKKPKKGSKNTKPITKIEDCPSFFNFFNPPQIPEGAELDEDTVEQLENQMEDDYETGSTIRDNIIPKAVLWFTGEAVQGDEFEEDDEDEDEYEDEKEEEDGKDDDEE